MVSLPVLKESEVNEKILINLSRKLKKFRVNDLELYLSSKKLKDVLLSAIDISVKGSDELWQKILPVKDNLERCLESYAKRYSKSSPKIKPLVRYLLWNTYYSFDKPLEIIEKLISSKHLFKSGKEYFVTGLHLAVGSSVFGVSASGGKYRLTTSCSDIQAFCVNNRWTNLLNAYEEEKCIRLKKLDNTIYTKYYIGNEEGKVRICFTKEDKTFILTNYVEK